MKKSERSSFNIIYIIKLSNTEYVGSMVLLFYPCKREEESIGDHLQEKTTAKSTFQLEGLDDGFCKQYEAYAQFVIDTTSAADNNSHVSKEILEMVALFTSFEETCQQKVEAENPESSVSSVYAIMKIDSIFCIMDSVIFDIKSINKNAIVFSLDMTGSDSEEKRYRMWGENIMATHKKSAITQQP